MLLSLVVPCYNEQSVLSETHRQIVAALTDIENMIIEVIYVDDGSNDQTPAILRELSLRDQRVRAIRLSRNFGHQIAVTAGLEHAMGDAVVIMDADLQDPPEVIPEMIARWREGYDVVYGTRIERDGESAFKLWSAALFYRLINNLSDTKMPPNVGDFRLLDRRVVDVLLSMPERDRFLRGMISWVGFNQVEVNYRRPARHSGESKYPLLKMIRFASDAITSFSLAPLRLTIWIGFLSIAIAFAGIIYALIVRIYTNDWVRGWASIFTAVLFVGGVQLVTLGILGEYVGRIYTEVKRRPLYAIQERLGFGQEREMHVRDEHSGRAKTANTSL